MMFLADFHVHSNFSDGRHSIPDLVDYFGRLGFGAVAFTDHLCEDLSVLGKASAYLGCTLTHATFPIYQSILRSEALRAWEEYGLVVIPGVELTKNSLSNHRSAHVLGIGVREWISANEDIPELCRELKNHGAISIAAHPVWTRKMEPQTYQIWDRRKELANIFDAWELASGPYLFEEVRISNLPKIASSDMHISRQMTSWKTVLRCERSEEAILEAIRRQDVEFQYYEAPYDMDDRRLLSAVASRHRRNRMGDLGLSAASPG